jgi:hypothetical protein
LSLIFLAGVYLVFTSGRFDFDPFTLVSFVLVLGLIIYIFVMSQRSKDQ